MISSSEFSSRITDDCCIFKLYLYDNCRISRALIGLFLIVNMRTDTNLKFMRRVSKRERAIRQFVIVKNKLASVLNVSVLLLAMNFVITLSKKSADPLGYRLVNPQLL